MDCKIREMRPGEAAELKKIASPNFSIVERLFMPKPKIGIVVEDEKGHTAGGAFLVIVDTGHKKVGCIDIIFVLPRYRGCGIAKRLYHEAVHSLHERGCETVMALVRGDNSPSLMRFEAEGLYPVSLYGLTKRIGTKATAALFIKTASLACATGCWILCENATPQDIGGSIVNIIRTFLVNGILLLGGALLGSLNKTVDQVLWNFAAAWFWLAVITLGESIGKKAAGGHWQFCLPEGGLVPSAIIALLGGFYPLLGHWYLVKRENTAVYRDRMAAPAKSAWALLMLTTVGCSAFGRLHPFFACASDIGVMLLLFYMLPFYPFDTFGGKRIRESNEKVYAAFVTFSIITVSLLDFGILPII